MRKIFVYIIIIVGICFFIPFLGAYKFESKEVFSNKIEEVKIENKNYDYGIYNKIKLLHVSTNNVEELNIDEYLYGVVSSEMPASYEIEALKAQAIVARTYTIYKIKNSDKHEGADICDDSKCCQAWISKNERLNKWKEEEREENWNKILEAVNSTKGKIITYNNEPINAFFHANSGGITEIPINVWGGSGYPYLQSVTTSGEENYTQYNSEVSLTREELTKKIKDKYNDFEINWNEEECIKILEYTDGNRVKTLKIGNKNLAGVDVRTIIGLKSANFDVKIEENSIRFIVKGYGHGVGMSQTGADSMAKEGKGYEDIIKHFYTGVEIKDI